MKNNSVLKFTGISLLLDLKRNLNNFNSSVDKSIKAQNRLNIISHVIDVKSN